MKERRSPALARHREPTDSFENRMRSRSGRSKRCRQA